MLIETMSDSYELKAAVLAAKEAGINPKTGARLPIFATVIYDEKREKLLTGGNVESTVALLEGLGVDVLGKLRSGTGTDEGDRKRYPGKFLLHRYWLTQNAGLPRSENGKTVYDVDPKDFAAVMEEIVKNGCCGNRRLLWYYTRSHPGHGRTDKGYPSADAGKEAPHCYFFLFPGCCI